MLYGFEFDKDLVFDELHAFSLDIVKNQVLFLREDEDSINRKEVDKRLEKYYKQHNQNVTRIINATVFV